MKILATIRPAFLPNLEYFWQILQSDVAIFTDHLPFSKGQGLNRSAPLNTPETVLTIPIQHGQPNSAITEKLLVDDPHWRQKHLKTLHHLFHNFPFAFYYLPQIEEIYASNLNKLADFLFILIKNFLHWLHLPVQIVRSTELTTSAESNTLIINWCKQFECQGYIAEQKTFQKGWVDAKYLKNRGIQPFVLAPLPKANLLSNYASKSILHFLLQFGPEAGYILKQYSTSIKTKYSE